MLIKFFAGIKQQLGIETLEIKLDSDVELRKVLEEIRASLGSRSKYIFQSSINLNPGIKLMLNGEYIEDLSHRVNDRDELAILPPVSGG